MKFKILILPILFLGLFFASSVFAQEKNIEIDLFYLTTCPHCHSEIEFLNSLKEKYSQIEVNTYIVDEKENLDLMLKKYKDYQVPQNVWGLVPAVFFEDNIYIIGFEENVTDKKIESYILQFIEKRKEVEIETSSENKDPNNVTIIDDKREISIPFLGKINVSEYSPIILSVILGTLDGFNPCAMTALCFLLASLISSGIRKRVLLIGGVFIFISGFVYFLFISAWFNLFLALAYVKFITTIVGIFVVFFAFNTLKEYFSGVICKFCETEAKKDFFSEAQKKLLLKMEKMTRAEVPIFISLISVALIAAGVNMVELFCTMGFPAAFTGILSDLDVSRAYFYLYLLIYIFFYMLDDLIIFLIAVATLKITQSSQKYLRFVKLVSGILLLVLGLILIFNPGLLNFA
jgi:cytochrome c biogenesis protein CcdA/glutaredoxin-related protein